MAFVDVAVEHFVFILASAKPGAMLDCIAEHVPTGLWRGEECRACVHIGDRGSQ